MYKVKDDEHALTQISSGQCVICIDKIDCCLACIKRRRKAKRNNKNTKARDKLRRKQKREKRT